MVITLEQLRDFVRTADGEDFDTELQSCIDVTDKLLDELLEDALETVPEEVRDRAHLLSAAEMFNQGQAPNGVLNQQYDDGTSAPIRIGADPLRPAYPLVGRYLPGAIVG